ncbi:MAG: PAS domain S-box protein [Candidatus Cyclobacteriaceae bacterium M3_2C_046]
MPQNTFSNDDLTARISELENTLSQFKNTWETALNAIDNIILVISTDYTITEINQAGLELFQKSREEILHKKCYEVLDHCKGTRLNCPLCQDANPDNSKIRIVKIKDKYFSIKTSPMYNAGGEIISYVDVLSDVTQSKQTEAHLNTKNKEYRMLNQEYLVQNEEFQIQNEDLQETNDALKQSEELFRGVWESARDGMAISDPKGMVLKANPAYLQMFGYEEHEVVGNNFCLIFPSKFHEIAKKQYIEQFNAINVVEPFDAEVVRKDGTTFYVESNISFFYQNGERILMLSLVRDVTAYKKAEIERKRNEFLLKEAQRISNVGHYYFDLKKDRWNSSEMLDQIFGIDSSYPHDVDGWIQLVHPDEQEQMLHYLEQEVMQKGQPFNHDYRIIDQKTGLVKHVHGIGELFWDQDGQLDYMVGIIQDVSRKKEIEAALTKSNKKFNDIVSSIPGGVFQFIFDHSGQHTIPFFSSGAYQIFDIEQDQALDMELIRSRIFPDDLDVFYRELDPGFQNVPLKDVEIRVMDRQQQVKWIRIRATALPAQENTIWNGIILDNSQEKLAQQALQESQERYKLLSNITFEGILIHDQGIVKDCNESFCHITGYQKQELLGKNAIEILIPEQADRDTIREKVIKQYAQPYIVSLKKQDGTTFICEIEARSFLLNQKEVRIAAIRDVTQREQILQDLKKSEEKYRLLAETARDMIFIHDMDGMVNYVNTATKTRLGYDVKDLNKCEVADLVHPAEHEKMWKRKEERLKKNIHNFTYETTLISKTGDEIPVEISSAMAKETEGNHQVLIIARDISERKKTEQELRISEDRFRSLFENSISGILYVDLDGNVLEANPRIIEMMGSPSLEATKAINVFEFQPLIDMGYAPKLKECIKTGMPVFGENEYSTKWGKHLFVKYYFNPIKRDDQVIGVLANIDDITDIKLAEEHLKANEERFRLVATHTNDIIYEWNLQNDQLTWHGPISKLLDRENIPGTIDDLIKLIHPEDLPPLTELVEKCIEQRKPYSGQYRILLSGDEVKYISGTGVAIYQKDKPIIVYGAITDITQEKLLIKNLETAKKKAEENEKLFRSTFEQAAAGIVLIAPDQTFIMINQKFCDMLGYSQEEMMKLDFNRITYPPDMEQDKEVVMKILSNEISEFLIEKRYIHKNGSLVWITGHGTVIRDENNIVQYIMGVVSDMTQQKLAELALMESEKELKAQNEEYMAVNEELTESNNKISDMNLRLTKANQELDSFVYRVSHDLRAPITSSLGLSQLSQQSNALSELHQFARLQEESLQKLDNFIKDILNYSRNSRTEIKPELINFSEIIDNILSENFYNQKNNQLKIHKELTPTSGFKSDLLRIKIILNNLISNALKFQNHYQEKPFITIKTENYHHYVILTISDNGIGIKPEHIHRIFEMFYRATDKKPGSGIGLYIVKDCLDKIDGEISLESAVGEGTTFRVKLPNLS